MAYPPSLLPSSQVRLGVKVQISLVWHRQRIFDQEVASLFLGLVRDTREAVVERVTEKVKTKSPPVALHTVELLRAASAKLHIGPKQAMDIAERLYTEVR